METREIKRAAEAIACAAWERGASADGIAEAIDKAFAADSAKVRGQAHAFATMWLANVESVKGE